MEDDPNNLLNKKAAAYGSGKAEMGMGAGLRLGAFAPQELDEELSARRERAKKSLKAAHETVDRLTKEIAQLDIAIAALTPAVSNGGEAFLLDDGHGQDAPIQSASDLSAGLQEALADAALREDPILDHIVTPLRDTFDSADGQTNFDPAEEAKAGDAAAWGITMTLHPSEAFRKFDLGKEVSHLQSIDGQIIATFVDGETRDITNEVDEELRRDLEENRWGFFKVETGRCLATFATKANADIYLKVITDNGHTGYEIRPIHYSWCATHNEPAFPAGACDCGAPSEAQSELDSSQIEGGHRVEPLHDRPKLTNEEWDTAEKFDDKTLIVDETPTIPRSEIPEGTAIETFTDTGVETVKLSGLTHIVSDEPERTAETPERDAYAPIHNEDEPSDAAVFAHGLNIEIDQKAEPKRINIFGIEFGGAKKTLVGEGV